MFRPGNLIYAYMLIIITVVLLSVLVVNYYTNVIVPFIKDKEYIKAEIGRSTGHAKKHWQKKLKRHNLSLIPFIGKFLAKKVK